MSGRCDDSGSTGRPAASEPPASAFQAEHLAHELRVHQAELEIQNEQLRRVQQQLEASRDRYLDLYEHAPVGYVTIGFDGYIVEANRLALVQLGLLSVPAPGTT